MFTEKERINLILLYGLEDAIELYAKYNNQAYKHLNEYKNINKQLLEKLSLAISYIERQVVQ
ncbi:hypothetical protein D6861_007950 [Macrococcoides caseolyticum]|uniref:Uncharacterized protein n=1 Tax=Macrococcus psychrotolerans TaxID=3039389 RepID=A0AAU6REU8_9STAP|nr:MULTISPECIES: hypothetical protein [Macrococcus]MBQ5152173.1 hypothetical protein [Macrococcus caseolyticus]MDJ1112036.1 hypothetical protein [Macrococcus sp. S115]QYA32694.1 hypothetical protein KYI10_10220 [Macrococcus sp. 19Msa1099]QYA37507.1 hypothetical protein KYI07_10215 [Macrococcus caseolyticus]QYA76214.1 hypothetical protein KYI12_10210 [Macrococcus caseolyticus]